MRFSRSTLEHLTVCLSVGLLLLWKGGKAVDATWMVGALAIILTGLDCMAPRTSRKIPGALLGVTAAFGFWTILSFVFSKTMNYGLDEVIQTVSLLLIFVWAMHRAGDSAGNHALQTHVARTIAAAVLIACTAGIAVYCLQPVSRFVGTFFDYRFHTDYWPNAWGEYVLLAWPMLVWSLWLHPKAKNGYGRFWIVSLASGILLGCLLLSYSRGSMIALGCQFVVASGLMIIGRLRIALRHGIAAAAIIIVSSVMLFGSVNSIRSQRHTVESVIKKATFTSDEKASSVSERSQFWHQAVILASAHPLVGWGPYSFRFVQPALQQDVLATADHPHNVLLKLAAERGIPAAIFFGLIFVIVFGLHLQTLRTSKREHHDPATRWFVLASFVAIAGVLAHNMIDYNLQFVGISLPLWLIAGLGSGMALRHESTVQSTNITLVHTCKMLLAVLLCSVLVLEGRYLFLSSRGRRAEAAGDRNTALQYYDKTTQSLFTRDTLLSMATMYLKHSDTQKAEAVLASYMKQNSEDGRAWKLRGDTQTTNNLSRLESYTEAYRRLRYNDVTVVLAYVTALATHDRQALDARRLEIDSLINDFQLAVQNNTHFIDLSPNVEALATLSRIMAGLYPDTREAYEDLALDIMQKSAEERARQQGRPSGILW